MQMKTWPQQPLTQPSSQSDYIDHLSLLNRSRTGPQEPGGRPDVEAAPTTQSPGSFESLADTVDIDSRSPGISPEKGGISVVVYAGRESLAVSPSIRHRGNHAHRVQ